MEKAGGKRKTNTGPRRILVENERVVGVETDDGDILRARKLVASGLNPQQTFLDLIDPMYLPQEWINGARGYRYNLLAPLFALNVNLSEPPRYAVTADHPNVSDALMVIVGIDDTSRFDEIVQCHKHGLIPSTVMWGSCPTQFDPSQAPSGQHTAFMWEKLPYRLQGDARNWDSVRDDHALAMIDTWNRYAPGLQDSILDWFAASPLDTERRLPNMREGDLLVGSFAKGQVGYNRPFAGAGHYRGHLKGLYLCGSCCHPGGNITGLPGYNAAQVAFSDLSLPAPWAPPPIHDVLA